MQNCWEFKLENSGRFIYKISWCIHNNSIFFIFKNFRSFTVMIIYFDKLKCFLIKQYRHIVLMYFHVFWIERHLCGLPVLYVRSGDVCFRYVHFLYTGNQESCAGGSHRFRWRWCNSNRGKEWERQMQCRIKIEIEMNSVSDHRYQHHMADNKHRMQPLFDIWKSDVES